MSWVGLFLSDTPGNGQTNKETDSRARRSTSLLSLPSRYPGRSWRTSDGPCCHRTGWHAVNANNYLVVSCIITPSTALIVYTVNIFKQNVQFGIEITHKFIIAITSVRFSSFSPSSVVRRVKVREKGNSGKWQPPIHYNKMEQKWTIRLIVEQNEGLTTQNFGVRKFA